MLGEEHVAALLHLGAIAVAVTAGYLGLDRVKGEAADSFRDELSHARDRVRKLLLRLDIKKSGKAQLKTTFDTYQIHILCHIGQEPIELGIRRVAHAIRRQKHIPILGYFRNRADRSVVAIMGIVSTAIFLTLTASVIWDIQALASPWVVHVSFVVLSGIILWIFITAALSYKLLQIGALCERFETEVTEHLNEVISEATRAIPSLNGLSGTGS